MTPKERAVAALNLQVPDMVPTFELDFQLEKEIFGKSFYTPQFELQNWNTMNEREKSAAIFELAEYMVKVYSCLEYSIIPLYPLSYFQDNNDKKLLVKYLKEMIGDNYMLASHGDGTFGIPHDGSEMHDFVYRIVDDPEGMRKEAENYANYAIELIKIHADMGVDCRLFCRDYCFNSGPFLSPSMFEEFVQPYLYKIIDEAKKSGLYTIKHTDGNIMPILNQLVECKPHAIHSLDPMAGVDIKLVKELVGDKVCLCGNVNCALMQMGTDDEVIASAEYAITYGKPGGGYIFCTSNVPFEGLPPERYSLILDVWKRMRKY